MPSGAHHRVQHSDEMEEATGTHTSIRGREGYDRPLHAPLHPDSELLLSSRGRPAVVWSAASAGPVARLGGLLTTPPPRPGCR